MGFRGKKGDELAASNNFTNLRRRIMQNDKTKIVQICAAVSEGSSASKFLDTDGEYHSPCLWALVEYPDRSREIEPVINKGGKVKRISVK
jgi:hypothetical protein